MDHYPEWEAKVMDQCYDTVDYLALHHYHIAKPGDILSLLGGSLYYEDFINTETAMLDYIQAKHRSPKKVNISFDEYGAFEREFKPLNPGYGPYNMARVHYHFDPERKYILHDPDKMPVKEFPGGDMIKLLSMTSIQLALLRHADRVKISCMTAGLGALCSADHDHVWKSASHYAFLQLLEYAKGTSMRVSVDSPVFDMSGYAIDDTSQYTGKNDVPYIDSACAWNEEKKRLTVFVINRNLKEEYPLEIDVRAFDGYAKMTHYQMFSEDFDKKSSFENPWKEPEINKNIEIKNGVAVTKLKPLSWNVITFEKQI
jgi:alpha-N-arabinofuranosidase